MRQLATILAGLILFAAAVQAAPPAQPDDRAALRTQVENELAQRRARMTLIEQELERQSKRYDAMAAQRMELAKMASERAEAAKAAAAERAMKAKYAAAQAGPKPPKKAAKGAKQGNDAEADAGKGAGVAKSAEPGGAKAVDPLLTQNYLVLRLRDEARQLRERITYLEGLLARL